MPFNLLLLPLLGGFIFTRQWKRTRYYALRSDGYVLLFYAASCGALFLLAAAFVSYLVASIQTVGTFVAWWHRVVPIEHSGKAALAFVMSASLWYPLNWGQKDESQIDRVIQRKQDPLELLLRTAMGEHKLVLLSVKNGKLYVGYIISNLNPAFPMESLGMLPMMSGYRRSTKKTACFTTFYTSAYDKIEQEIRDRLQKREIAEDEFDYSVLEALNDELDDFQVVIPISEIQSAAIFKLETYDKYFRIEQEKKSPLSL